MASQVPTESQVATNIEWILRELLPPEWKLDVERPRPGDSDPVPDLLVTITAPSGERVRFVGEAKREATGPQLQTALRQLRRLVRGIPDAWPLFLAPWISERSREQLASEGVAFVDATGNLRLIAERPGLFVTATGSARNPWPPDKALQSLRGRGAGRAVRALLDFTPPYGVRELASRSKAPAATLSRVIDLLERESLVERDERGTVIALDWVGTIRRWAHDYDVLRTNESAAYLQPRGLQVLIDTLKTTTLRYAVTGSLAANEFTPFAPARLAMVYVDNLREASTGLDLREADAGANVVLLEPYDDVAYSRLIHRSELHLVNPTQLAVDLLTGPGRAPSEGEQLLVWMRDNIDEWRT